MAKPLDLTRHELPSGLTILVESIPWVRSVSLGYYVRSGSAAETDAHAGASHFLEHLVFKGTERRSTTSIASEIDALGGEVDAFTGKEFTSFYAHVLDEQIEDAIDLLTDIVLHPKFSDSDLEMERGVIFEEIRMVEDTPDDLVHELFIEEFWKDHPLGRPILGTAETIERLSRSEIEEHLRETFAPQNMMFVASGNVRPEAVIRHLERAFDGRERGNFRGDWSEPQPNQHVTLRQKEQLEQVHLSLGMRGYAQERDERYAAALFNSILGGGMSSRLFQRIREQEGLVYSVASFHNAHLHGGYESIYAACNRKNVRKVLDLTLDEMRVVRRDGVTADELTAAKRYLKGSILLSLESTVSRMSGIARQEFYFGRQYSPDEIIEHVEGVSLDDIRAVAEHVLDPSSVSLTLLGDLNRSPVDVNALRAALG